VAAVHASPGGMTAALVVAHPLFPLRLWHIPLVGSTAPYHEHLWPSCSIRRPNSCSRVWRVSGPVSWAHPHASGSLLEHGAAAGRVRQRDRAVAAYGTRYWLCVAAGVASTLWLVRVHPGAKPPLNLVTADSRISPFIEASTNCDRAE